MDARQDGREKSGDCIYFVSERQVESIGLRYSNSLRCSSCGRMKNGIVSLSGSSNVDFSILFSVLSGVCGCSEGIVSEGSC